MSWQLATFGVVLATLGACFGWYERSRPSSKVVAVVASMAALTALGRDAFAAIPDVKPTTAMVFVCGYVFGAGPGFAIGAVGALASNLVLGEGPWTPWQMLAWGGVGIAGALVGRVTWRRLARVPLALSCALAAVGFNLVMDGYTWTLSGSHTLSAYVAVLATALTFDLTHVAASFAFGFAFGPALVRMLARVRMRLDVHWQPVRALPLAVVLGVAGMASLGAGSLTISGRASAAPASDTAAAVAYLRRAQNSDGGFGAAPGQASSEEFSAWTAMGLAAAGVDPQVVARGGHTVVDALRGGIGQLSGAGDLERTILALHAARVSPTMFAGHDLIAELLRQRSGDGSFQQLSNATAFAIFALRAVGRLRGDPVVRAAGRWLAAQQNADGGFGFGSRGVASDIDDTAAALQGLVDAAAPGPGVGRATAFLRRQQNGDGGFPLEPGGGSDAQSTAWAVQALLATGVDPSGVNRRRSPSPLDYLHRLVSGDGSVRYSSSSSQTPTWVTAQALTAFGAKPFPVPPATPGAGALALPSGAGSSSRSITGTGPGRATAGAGVAARPAGRSARTPRARGSRTTHGRPPSVVPGTAAARIAAAQQRVDALTHAYGALAGMLLGRIVG